VFKEDIVVVCSGEVWLILLFCEVFMLCNYVYIW